MKKLLMTLGIIVGFTAAVSAQSLQAKPAETAKPVTKPATAPVRVVKAERPVTKETPVVVATDAAAPVKPATKTKIVKPAPTETGMQAPEARPVKEKGNN